MKKLLHVVFLSVFCFAACDVIRDKIEKPAEHKVIIIGSGPAGLTAAIYAVRAALNPLVIEGPVSGGQLTKSANVENWPGERSISGMDLMMQIRDHAIDLGATLVADTVTEVDFSQRPYTVTTANGNTHQADMIIVATGSTYKKLGCPGEEEFEGRGVSYCATCDGFFFKNEEIVMVGGGLVALQDTQYLSKIAKHVTLIHTSPEFRSKQAVRRAVEKNPKVTIIHSAYIKEIVGDDSGVTEVVVQDKETKKISSVKVTGVFIAVGQKPNTDVFKGQLELTDYGHIALTDGQQASKKGIFAAGNVSDNRYRQAVTAAGDACKAVHACMDDIEQKG